MRFSPLGRRGTILIGIVFTMMVFVLMAVTGASMFADQAYISVHVMRMAEVNSVRTGVADYVLKWLQDDANSNWSDTPTTLPMTLGGHHSTVTFANAARNSITVNMITETEESAATASTASKSESFGVYRVPRAFYYPLFRGSGVDETGNPELLSLVNTRISRGVIYSNGNMSADPANGSTVQNGEIFHSQGSTISGGPTAPQRAIADPQPAMPGYETDPSKNSYEARIADYNALIADAQIQGVGDLTLPAGNVTVADLDALENPPDADDVAEARDFIIRNVTTITGPGRIVAWRNILFQENFPGSCRQNDDNYKSSDGGCKRLAGPHNGLVFSAELADAIQADAATACVSLNASNHGGYSSGWRPPTEAELAGNAGAALAGAHFNFLNVNRPFWSATAATTVNLFTGASEIQGNPTDPFGVVCVRPASANNRGTATVNPNGKLELIAGWSLVKSDDARGLNITAALNPADAPTVLYSRNERQAPDPDPETDQLFISGSPYAGVTTTIQEALFMAGRRLMIHGGAQAGPGESILYVRRHPVSNVNNYLDIAGPPGAIPTDANATRVFGTLISVSERNPNLILRSGADIEGIVYSNRIEDGTDDGGRLEMSNTRVKGSVIANRLQGGVISNVEIIGAPVNYPLARQVPDGFSCCVYKEPDSWRGD